jgi:hypothetical protein
MRIAKPVEPALILMPFAACVLIYWPTLAGGLLSDDYAVLGALWGWAQEGDLLAVLLSKFHAGLDSPSFYYRPLSMASFGVNVVLAGAHPLQWRATNLVLHLVSGAMVLTIVRRFSIEYGFGGTAIAPALAAAAFLLFPMSPEAVAWVSGRYDLLAVFFMLATIALIQRSTGWRDRWSAAALLTTACALASKESAALLPVFVTALAVARRAAGSRAGLTSALALGARDALPWILLGVAYFALRAAIFGTPFQVYAGSSPLRALASGAWMPEWSSASAWVDATLPLPFARAVFLAATFVVLVVGAMASWRRREAWANWLAIGVSALLSILLLLPHVPQLAADGEQGRLLYSTSAFVALLIGLGVVATMPLGGAADGSAPRSRRATALGAGLVLIVAELFLLRATVASWSVAGAQARALVAALPATAGDISGTGYGLVLVPDRLGSVPFGRNAQGGMVEPPTQAASLSSRLIVQTPADLPAWPANAQRGLVDALRRYPLSQVWAAVAAGRASGTALPTDYFCWAESASAIVKLSLPPSAAQADWMDPWRRALATSPCKEAAAELGAR